MITFLDCNNFWSPSGGGVRRYHLEKIEYYKEREDITYVFVMHDHSTFSEQIGPNAFIEHIKVPKVPGKWEYRYLLRSRPLESVILKYRPDVIEVGSPYILPSIVHRIIRRNQLTSQVFGFWHADFPVTYVARFFRGTPFKKIAEKIAWRHARKQYNKMKGVLVASQTIMRRMQENGMKNLHYSPLGVNTELFHPTKRDEELVTTYKAGQPNRLILFFPHRFSKEKGLHILIKAYDILAKSLAIPPALILAGTGPYEHLVTRASAKYEHVHYVGFIHKKEEMARYYASSDIAFALSEWETFGLALVEALSSGISLISASEGAAPEHITNSGAGIVLEQVDPENLSKAIQAFAEAKTSNWGNLARKYAEKLSWNQCFDNQRVIYENAAIDK